MKHTDWYKDAVIYQIYPRSFCDGNGDGLGVIDDENSLSIMYYHGNFSYGWGPIDDALFTEEGFYPYHVGEALIMCVASDIRENR